MEAAFVQRDFALDMSKSALYCTGMNAVKSPSGLSAVHRGQQQLRALAAQADRRERVLERVDQLVRGMEAVAKRLSSEQVSSTQRSVLISRFNDMQRRVNEIDGVVGSEGRGDAVSATGTVGAGQSLTVETPKAAEQTFEQVRQVRRQIEAERSRVPAPSALASQEAGASQGQGSIVDLQA